MTKEKLKLLEMTIDFILTQNKISNEKGYWDNVNPGRIDTLGMTYQKIVLKQRA